MLEAARDQDGLIVELTTEAAGGIQDAERNLRKRIAWGRDDEVVEALDAKLLSALGGDLEDSICCDDEEIAGRGFERKAIELRHGEEADWKLRLIAL